MKVSKKFVKEYVATIYAFGGQIDKDDVVEGKFAIKNTSLTASSINKIKAGDWDKKRFMILLDGGAGWGDAVIYGEGDKDVEQDMLSECEEEER